MPGHQTIRAIAISVTLLVPLCAPGARAAESIEFVSEHLAEVPMDDRYATLPLWGPIGTHPGLWHVEVNTAYSRTEVRALRNEGPMIAIGVGRRVGDDTHVTGFAFVDDLELSSAVERRPLAVLFARNVPLTLPAAAEFAGLAGSERDIGAGFAVRRSARMRLLHEFEWTAGLLWQRVALRDYRFNYRVLDGPDAGTTGTVAYDATYSYVTTFAGIALPRGRGVWGFTPHVQLAVPLPRYGVAGRITGPGFDLAGDTDAAGAGKHFGDPSLTFGLDIAYRPWNLAVDVGSTVSQRLLEPVINEGVTTAWLIAVRWTY